ncbi:MAG: alpha/beta fold hydrolase [Actinomycetota bacterium]
MRQSPSGAAGPSARFLLLLAVFALVAAACAPIFGDDDEGADGGDDTPSTQVDGADTDTGDAAEAVEQVVVDARFVDGPCGFEAPLDTSPRCGTVAVPVDWATGEGSIEIAVAVFSSPVANPAADPVVYLEGGPGGHALETARFVNGDLIQPLLERGDLILLDQRGAGLSEPDMSCDEVTALQRELEDSPGQSNDEVTELFHESLRDCRARLEAEGIDLDAFHTVNNAHDIEAVRIALGYEQWNLLGISYGTKLALEVMRQHPDGVRTAIIDSVFPQAVDSVRDNPQTFLNSFDAVVAACAAEPACAAEGDLGQRLIDVVQTFEADPVQVEVQDFLSGTSDDVFVEGDTIVGILTQALYSPYWFTDLPELVAELEDGDTDAVASYLSQQRTNEPFFTDGMFYAIECNEEIVFADPAEVAAAMPADPFGLDETFDFASNNGSSAFGTCEAFGAGTPPAGSNDAVVSDIPTLVMAGEFDPVTPVSWAEEAAETLENSFLVVAPFDSHGVSPGECGMGIVRSFLDDPATEPDASCFDDGAVTFLGAPPAVDLEDFSYDTGFGAELTGVRPSGWEQGDLLGDFYRQESLLDSTLFFQLAGNDNLAPLVDDYLAGVIGITLDEGARVPGPGGRAWNYRQGTNDGLAAEVYDTTINGFPVYVLLVTAEPEVEQQIDDLLLPVLAAIDVQPL